MDRYLLLKRNVDYLMKENGVKNYAELASLSGLQQPTLHRIIRGKSKDPSIGSLESIGNALGVPFWALVEIDMIAEGITRVDTSKFFRQLKEQSSSSMLMQDDLRLRKCIELAIQSLQVFKADSLPTPEEISRCAVAIYRTALPVEKTMELEQLADSIAHASIS